ncbi:hypothetical protein L7F22_028580 [Adiantum nelumboides]|nr:hypothetical protein [Adiantum nelumboides]
MASAPSHSRQLLLIVEGTAALGHHWELLRTEYLDKIIKSFCDGESLNQKTPGPVAEMALVVFYTHGPYNGCLLQQTGWTTNSDKFCQWVSSINFTGGGFGDAAIAEGLAEALLMCCPTPVANSVSQVTERQKHCILVAASNPHRLPTPIPRPPVQGLPQPSTSSDPSAAEHWWLADADTVAKAFSQCSVSLSVISPRQLLSLKSIFNMAKRTTRTADTPMEVSKYSHHMVLISDSFVEARQALIHSGGPTAALPSVQLPKVETSSATSLPSAPQAPAATVRAPTAGRALVVNQVLLATAWFTTSCWTLYPQALSRLRRLVRNLLWGGSDGTRDTRPCVCWRTVILPRQERDLGIIDPEMQSAVLLSKLIVCGLYPEEEPWKQFMLHGLSRCVSSSGCMDAAGPWRPWIGYIFTTQSTLRTQHLSPFMYSIFRVWLTMRRGLIRQASSYQEEIERQPLVWNDYVRDEHGRQLGEKTHIH